MSKFDITTDEETPAQRAAFGETLRNAWVADEAGRRLHPVLESALKQPGMVTTAAAREMIHTMQRRRRATEERSAHRARWIGYLLLVAAVLIGAGAMVTPNPAWSAVLDHLSLVCVAFAGGVWLRGRL